MKVFLNFFLKYLVLIVFAFIWEISFSGIEPFVIYNILENICFALAIICPLYFFNNGNYKIWCLRLLYLVFSFCLYFETVYYYLFKTFFSSSAIFVTLDSNAQESKEFLSFYMDLPVIVFSVLFLVLAVFLFRKIKCHLHELPNLTKSSKVKMVFLFLGIVVFTRQSTLIRFNLPYLIIKSGSEYYFDLKKMVDYKYNKLGDFDNLVRLKKSNTKEVHVIIIGESTSRAHLGIYDYYRNTTPRLDSIKNQLLIYRNAISPHAFSVGSLTKILTLGNYEHPEKKSEGSIVQLLNAAGFETYWISNQRPIGVFESMITKISLSANHHQFLTTTVAGNSKVLDGELLEAYNKILKLGAEKKVIFIHLMGTHHHYENRYPDSFKKFTDQPNTKFPSKESFEKINHYDNAVLYNDFIISEVIKKLDSLNAKSFALYFSDHGEEMYSNLDMAGHNEDIYSKQMFEIPFFLWRSHKMQEESTIYFKPDRKYMIDDMFHSVADLLYISAKQVDTTRSIFNKGFVERKRIIKDTIDFDTFFN